MVSQYHICEGNVSLASGSDDSSNIERYEYFNTRKIRLALSVNVGLGGFEGIFVCIGTETL